jgi:hypothetical protein
LFLFDGERYSFINHTPVGEAINAIGVIIAFEFVVHYGLWSWLAYTMVIAVSGRRPVLVHLLAVAVFCGMSLRFIPPFQVKDLPFWCAWVIMSIGVGCCSWIAIRYADRFTKIGTGRVRQSS